MKIWFRENKNVNSSSYSSILTVIIISVYVSSTRVQLTYREWLCTVVKSKVGACIKGRHGVNAKHCIRRLWTQVDDASQLGV